MYFIDANYSAIKNWYGASINGFQKRAFFFLNYLYTTTVMRCKIKQGLSDPYGMQKRFDIFDRNL